MMTPDVKANMVRAIKTAWDRIAMDILSQKPGEVMEVDEIREIVADYVMADGWWSLSHEERDECLKEAITQPACM
jgi:predicted metal-dependent enzyme (double-stranded beta helix superfamily)